jgi:hypothetical protein
MRKILTDAAAIGNAARRTLNWRPKQSLGWCHYQRARPTAICVPVIVARRPIPVHSLSEPCWIFRRSTPQFWRGTA